MSQRSGRVNGGSDRRPLLALALGGLMMGLGHIYVGRSRRALVFFGAFASLQFALFGAVFLAAPSAKLAVFVSGFAALAAVYILAMLDAYRLASRVAFVERWFNRVPIYLAYFTIGALAAVSLIRMERLHLVTLYHVSSSSMSPTLLGGDYLLTNRQYDCVDCSHALAAGDIVVFEWERSIWVKRLVGLPGDRIKINNQVLSVNGNRIPRKKTDQLGSAELEHFHRESNLFEERLGAHSYLTAWGDLEGSSLETARVPADAVFVLGDNRDRSKDSREFGSIPLANIRGRVDQIWLSRHWRDGRRVERSGISFP